MQRYKIIHRTCYNFFGAVTLGPHDLRLRPREDHELRIEAFKLAITPDANLLWHRDVEGNSVAIASFETATTQLVIASEVEVQQFNESPLDFLVADYAIGYPFNYPADDHILLSPYLALSNAGDNSQLARWMANFWQPGEHIQTYTLLQRLAAYIYQNLAYRVREEPGVQSAEQTLSCGTGSCRDFAALFMAAARHLGLAARFVSGYLHTPLSNSIGATHAWAEIYLPGAGWKGFDPTIGDIVGSDHIAVAVARMPESIPPVAGTFHGAPHSQLEVGVWVSKY